MKFVAREDIELPIAQVWTLLNEFETFERAAMRRGAEVLSTGERGRHAWTISFTFRGKRRKLAVRLDRTDPPNAMAFSGEGKALEGNVALELVELGPRRTRLSVASEVRPRTLAARLFLQSARLARARLVKRYQGRIAQLATMIESRGKARASGF